MVQRPAARHREPGLPLSRPRSSQTDGFNGQDKFRISPDVELNFSLLYDCCSIHQPSLDNADYPQNGSIHSATDNVAPRGGISYRLSSKAVVRAGFGMFFARYQTGL